MLLLCAAKSIKNSLLVLVCGVALAPLLSSCALTEPKPVHVQVIHHSVLVKDMRSMARSLGVLAELYFKNEMNEQQMHNAVLNELGKIERVASNIGGDNIVTNYSVVNRYMGAFLYDVNLAKEFANRKPANYVPAHRLIRSCQSCHESM